VQKDGRVDIRAFTFCVLSHLQTAIHRRDVFTHPSWRYADPRANLLSDAEWEATRPIVCRTPAAGFSLNRRGHRERLWSKVLSDTQMDASPIPVSMRITITEADSSRPLGRSPPR
jgi:hypothetical protein